MDGNSSNASLARIGSEGTSPFLYSTACATLKSLTSLLKTLACTLLNSTARASTKNLDIHLVETYNLCNLSNLGNFVHSNSHSLGYFGHTFRSFLDPWDLLAFRTIPPSHRQHWRTSNKGPGTNSVPSCRCLEFLLLPDLGHLHPIGEVASAPFAWPASANLVASAFLILVVASPLLNYLLPGSFYSRPTLEPKLRYHAKNQAYNH